MHVGVCTITSKSRTVEDVIDVVSRIEADGIEVWGQDHVGDGTTERCRAIADYASARGVEIPVYGSYLRGGTPAFDETMDRELGIAEAFDAELIRVWAGEEEHQDVSVDHYAAVVEDLGILGDAAADLGLEVTVERHAGTVTNTTEGAAAVIDATPETVGLNWQPPFSFTADEIADDIEALAGITNNVHIQAKPDVDGGERCPLGFAYFDVANIVETLATTGFDGYIEIEFVTERSPYAAALAADVAFLEAVLTDRP